MSRAILGLGANLGDRQATISAAADAIEHLPKTSLLRLSGFYETEPIGVPDEQPDYLNCVAEIETQLSPEALLGACLGIEAALGRVRLYEKSPRVIDIDLILYKGQQRQTEELTLPHPAMLERAFVLVPLAELYPQRQVYGYDFSQPLEAVSGQRLRKI